jgi:hypothetical protein
LFDTLIRSVVGEHSRRRLATLLGGGALAAVLGRLGLDEAAAKCAEPGKKCGDGKKCCKGAKCKRGKCKCASGGVPCGGACCVAGQVCIGGVCLECPNGQQPCGTTCCQAGETCANGQCRPAVTCPSGQTDCGGVCVDLRSDEANCGACGRACGPEEECVGGGTCSCRFPHVECGNACCPLGQVCLNGTCTAGQGNCPAGADTCAAQAPCNGGNSCFCTQRLEGGTRCVDLTKAVPGCATCTTDFGCQRSAGSGFVCVRGGRRCLECADPNFGFCAPLCPN